MPIYKQDATGKFVPFEATPFPDLERTLEDWIERNPHLLIEGEELAVVARQPRTGFGKALDLLAIDDTGACVVIELKRGVTPREVVAQALEYAAWVDSLTFEQLDEMARDYAAARNLPADGLVEMYARAFGDIDATDNDEEAGAAEGAESRVTFNNRQRIVIVAERISDEVEQTLRYLRTRFSADVYGVAFSVHRADPETIITTTTVVGRERTREAGTRGRRDQESVDDTIARAKTELVREAAATLDDWISGLPGVRVERAPRGSGRKVLRGQRRLAYFSYASGWIWVVIAKMTDAEAAMLRSGLSEPGSLIPQKHGAQHTFRVRADADLALFKRIIEARAAETVSVL